jgi:molybdopterin-guanine dinucleotide biosynthesis protein A
MNNQSVTGLVLAGGKGQRMGGLDKGLQCFNGAPLALHALHRLQQQEDITVSSFMIVANRNIADYEAMGVPVWPDEIEGFAGPLAGFLTGLQHCQTDLLLTVPCDCPGFPLNLAIKLQHALLDVAIDVAMAATSDEDGQVRSQPVFCMMRPRVANNLMQFINEGGRKIETWVRLQNHVVVLFDAQSHSTSVFSNVNTLEELQQLEKSP